ncbi:GTPase [Glutamicibacter uratoxydans]|uniref:GTPase n=1 Tax=Glutamicibacter uratoxydans TaxID=43667 RepID=UPI003D6ECC7F
MSERQRARAASKVTEQIELLTQAFEISAPYTEQQDLERAGAILHRAEERRKLSTDHTVIGLFGATGSGKSSLFNALAGEEIARTGVVRPTTKSPVAAIWDPEDASELLDWLNVTERYTVRKPLSGSTSSRRAAHTSGLLLLDLPDMDSTAIEHHAIAQKLAGQVDFLIWVLDPQKYADASIHHGYLSTLSAQSSNLLVVLNQIDTVAPTDRPAVLSSLEALLKAEGLDEVPVILSSARTGEGIEQIRGQILAVMRRHELAVQRVRNDIDALATSWSAKLPASDIKPPAKEHQQNLEREVGRAHGTERIADVVATSYRLRAARNTGWPLTTWLTRLRNDPLKRMNLGRNDKPVELSLTSRPELSAAESAQVEQAVDRYVATAVQDLPASWANPLKDRFRDVSQTLAGPVDQAIASTKLGVDKRSWWWPLIKFLQWFSLLVALAGGAWLAALALAGFLQFSLPEPPRIEGIAYPTLLLVIGVLTGIVLGIGGSIFNRLIAKIKRKKAMGNLNKSVAYVVRQEVVDPTRGHVDRYNTYAGLIRQAAKRVQ